MTEDDERRIATAEAAARRQMRRTNLVVGIGIPLLFILGIYSAYQTAASRAASEAVKDSDAISACISGYRANIDEATAQVHQAKLQYLSAIADGLAAVAVNDDAALLQIVTRVRQAGHDAGSAQASLETANERFTEANEMRFDDPPRFLAGCRG